MKPMDIYRRAEALLSLPRFKVAAAKPGVVQVEFIVHQPTAEKQALAAAVFLLQKYNEIRADKYDYMNSYPFDIIMTQLERVERRGDGAPKMSEKQINVFREALA